MIGTVTKDACERYRVRDGRDCGDWATIVLRCWQDVDRRPAAGSERVDVYHCGEIMIHSSFGSWGYTWTACAVPFKQFLTFLSFGYVFGKLMGSRLPVFDGEASFEALQSDVLLERRAGTFDRDQARILWNALVQIENEACSCADSWIAALEAVAALADEEAISLFLNEPWNRIKERPDTNAVRFWNSLWPPFIAKLREEIEQTVVAGEGE